MPVFYHFIIRVVLSLSLPSDIGFNGISDSQLTRPLANLGQIGTTETLGLPRHEVCVDITRHWRLSQVSLQDLYTGFFIRQGDVYELIQTSRSQDGGVNDVWPGNMICQSQITMWNRIYPSHIGHQNVQVQCSTNSKWHNLISVTDFGIFSLNSLVTVLMVTVWNVVQNLCYYYYYECI